MKFKSKILSNFPLLNGLKGRTHPISWILIMLIKIYQKFVSPLTVNKCRFYPTCSEYFIQSLIHKGIVMGILKGILRIFKCHPFHPGGYDSVDGA